MPSRSALLTARATGALIDWVTRVDGRERVETVLLAGDTGYDPGSRSPADLARDGIPLRWCGTAARELGLQGETGGRAAARVLMHGVGPHGERLGTACRAHRVNDDGAVEELDRRQAFSWVLPAPKTVSLLLAHPDPLVQREAREAVQAAGEVAFRELEQCVTIRRGRGGTREEAVRGLVGVQVLHQSSSAGDPHLHLHFIIRNSAPSVTDGRWRALDSRTLFGAQRIAEAAFHAELERELHRRFLGLELIPHQVGPVSAVEIESLLPAIEEFSNARAHMETIATELGAVLPGSSHERDRLVWSLHRQRHSVAEAVEHAIDATLSKADAGVEEYMIAAEEIRGGWFNRLHQRVPGAFRGLEVRLEREDIALDLTPVERYRRALRGEEPPEVARWRELTEDARLLAAEAAQQVNDYRANHPLATTDWGVLDRLQRELDMTRVEVLGVSVTLPHRIPRALQLGLQLAECERLRQLEAELSDRRWHAEEVARQLAVEERQWSQCVDELRQGARNLLIKLSEACGGTLTGADVAAYCRSCGYSLDEARELAAEIMDYWHREGLLRLNDEMERMWERIREAVRKGYDHDTRVQQWALGHTGKLVPLHVLQHEQQVYEQALALSREHRRALAADMTHLTPDQARAAALAAEGRALVTIEGPAGAGKTHLLRPVVEAAQRREMDVIVLSRNARLAHELADELHIPAATLERFARGGVTIRRETLLVLDEAGLVDQRHWQAVLNTARDPRVQVIALGDRAQAQPIDRLATWAVVTEATREAGAAAELTQSFRCAKWHEEMTLLRSGDVAAASRAIADGRIRAADDPAREAAEEVLRLREAGQDAVALAATNERAAEIAEHVQRLWQVEIDPRTLLMHGQRSGIGDIVRTRRNDYEQRIRNGDTWLVVAIDDRTITLESCTDNRRAVVSHEWSRHHLELGYALTVDSAQGMTVDRAVVLVDQALGRSRLHTAGTRGREAPIYITDGSLGDPAHQVQAAIQRDDLAPTMREILGRSREDLRRDLNEFILRHPEAQEAAQRAYEHAQARAAPERGGPGGGLLDALLAAYKAAIRQAAEAQQDIADRLYRQRQADRELSL